MGRTVFLFLLGSTLGFNHTVRADESRFNAPPPLVHPNPSLSPAPSTSPASPSNPQGSVSTTNVVDTGLRSPAQEMVEASSAEAAVPAAATSNPINSPLFDEANFFSGTQAKDLRTRTAEEQVEILTRYVQIQSEQIRALRRELQQSLAHKSNPAANATEEAPAAERFPAATAATAAPKQ